MMEVFFEARSPESAKLRDVTLMRARFVLRRLVWLVPTVKVRLSDANALRGGTHKHCRVEVHTQGRGTVIVQTRADTWRTALDNALARAARLLLRAIRRIDVRGRTRRPALDFRP
jgi:hypothetical protein